MVTDYFAAASDEVAATAIDHAEGEPGPLDLTAEQAAANQARYRVAPEQATVPRVQVARSGLLVLHGKGVEPDTPLVHLEEILTDRTYAEIALDPRRAMPIVAGGRLIVSVTDTLRDALAAVGGAALPKAGQRWADAAFSGHGVDGATLFLAALTDLALQAVDRGEHLYCSVTA